MIAHETKINFQLSRPLIIASNLRYNIQISATLSRPGPKKVKAQYHTHLFVASSWVLTFDSLLTFESVLTFDPSLTLGAAV